MKINEVEALVGITKKNIRFYEEQALICPKRNKENSYREYSRQEVEALQQIKLLRKLGLPIEEIRKMLEGSHTVADGMRRHLVTLERDSRNLQQSIALCRQIQALDIPISALDAQVFLAQMDQMEQSGTTFQNKQSQDIRVRYIAPVLAAAAVILLTLVSAGVLVWAYQTAPEESPPLGVLLLCLCLFAAVVGGVLLALGQRIREIGKGEIDDAKRY